MKLHREGPLLDWSLIHHDRYHWAPVPALQLLTWSCWLHLPTASLPPILDPWRVVQPHPCSTLIPWLLICGPQERVFKQELSLSLASLYFCWAFKGQAVLWAAFHFLWPDSTVQNSVGGLLSERWKPGLISEERKIQKARALKGDIGSLKLICSLICNEERVSYLGKSQGWFSLSWRLNPLGDTANVCQKWCFSPEVMLFSLLPWRRWGSCI